MPSVSCWQRRPGSMPADHRELGGRVAWLRDLDLDLASSPRPGIDTKRHEVAAHRQRRDKREAHPPVRVHRRSRSRTPSAESSCTANRPGGSRRRSRPEVKDLAADLCGQLVERQSAGDLGVRGTSSGLGSAFKTWSRNVVGVGDRVCQSGRGPTSTPASAGSSGWCGWRTGRACPARRGTGPGRRTRRASSG